MRRPRFSHDPEADAVYVKVSDARIERTDHLDDARHIDYAGDGSVVGVELLYVSDGVLVDDLPETNMIAALLRRHSIKTFTEAELEAQHRQDPAWQRAAFARAVAKAVVRYRSGHDMSLRALAGQIGMPASSVVRLEAGTHNPSIDTLQRLSSRLGLRFVVDIAPVSRQDAQVTPPDLAVVQDVTSPDGSRLLVAAG